LNIDEVQTILMENELTQKHIFTFLGLICILGNLHTVVDKVFVIWRKMYLSLSIRCKINEHFSKIFIKISN